MAVYKNTLLGQYLTILDANYDDASCVPGIFPQKKNFKLADYKVINAYRITISWRAVLPGGFSTGEMWVKFIEVIGELIMDLVPVSTPAKSMIDCKLEQLSRTFHRKWDRFVSRGLERDKQYYEFARLTYDKACLLYTSPSPRDKRQSRMPSSA